MLNKNVTEKRDKVVLIATPAYGGMLTMEYFNGMARLSSVKIEGWEILTKVIKNESLVPRARQFLAKFALAEKVDKLLFIDADIGFTGEDVKKIVLHDKLVVGGTYPLKSFPLKLNFNPLPEHDVKDIPNIKSLEGMRQYAKRYGDKEGVVEVLHVPTGFLCIDVKVLRQLEPHLPYWLGSKYGAEKFDKIPEFFPMRIKNKNFESEDWAFCSLCKEHKIKIFLDTKIVLTHTGSIVLDVNKEYGGSIY